MSLLAAILGCFMSGGVLECPNPPLDYGMVSTTRIIHTGYSPDDPRQQIVQKAYDLGWLDFVTMIECENGRWDKDRVSATHDHWICQLNYRYNKKFINSEWFKDVYTQLEYCYEKRKINPKLWHWPNRKIKGQLCKDYVKDRFIINQ